MTDNDRSAAARADRRSFLRLLGIAAAASLLAACQSVPTAAPTPVPAPPTAAPPAAKPATASPSASPAASAPSPATTAPAVAKTGTAAINDIVEAAKKEGAVTWLDARASQENDKVYAEAFRRKYGLPDSFQVNHIVKGSGDVITQVQEEIRAGKLTVDLVWVGAPDVFDAFKKANALAAFEPTDIRALDKLTRDLNWPNDPPYWYSSAGFTFQPVWNKKFFTKEITSWYDTLDPAFKGASIEGDIRTSSTMTDWWWRLHQELPDYFQKYKDATDPVLLFRIPEQLQKITSGERLVTNAADPGRAYRLAVQDRNVQIGIAWPKEGITPIPFQQGVLVNAPHPNAGKLFADFLVSQEGQQVWLDYEGAWPMRTDLTYSEDLRRYVKRPDEVKLLNIDWTKVNSAQRDQARAEFRRIFQVS
jgi:iron(III) transport system substrate-binding protein